MMSKNQNELDEHLAGKLRLLAKVSPLNPEAVTEERQKFLAQAAMLRATAGRTRQPQVGGMQGWLLGLRGKQQRSFSNVLVALVLALALILGSTGATVYAAQQSLPDEFLYPVKILSEDTRLALAFSLESRLELMLYFSSQRVEEIAQLRALGRAVPEAPIQRAQEHLDEVLQIAADMNDPQLPKALSQIRNQAEVQSQQVTELISGDSSAVDPVLEQLRARLQAQVEYAAEGETNPEGFRELVRAWERERYRPTPVSGQQGTTPEPNVVPGANGENGNKPTGTPGQSGPDSPAFNHPPILKDSEPWDVNEPDPTPVPSSDSQLPNSQNRP